MLGLLGIEQRNILRVSDGFTRANAGVLGSADTGQAWSVLAGEFGIDTNLAKCITTALNKAVAVVDSGMSDCIVTVTFTTNADGVTRVVFRYDDVDNGLMVQREGTLYKLYKLEAGSYAELASASSGAADGDIVSVKLSGSSIIISRNGAAIITTTSVFNQTKTKHGIGANATTPRWSNFTVEALK